MNKLVFAFVMMIGAVLAADDTTHNDTIYLRERVLHEELSLSLQVEDFNEYWSPVFHVGGIPWKFGVYKTDNRSTNAEFDIPLVCQNPETASNWSIEAEAVFELFRNNKESIENEISRQTFSSDHLVAELLNVTTWDELVDEKSGSVENGIIQSKIVMTSFSTQERVREEFDTITFLNKIEFGENTVILAPEKILRDLHLIVEFKKDNDYLSVMLYGNREPKRFGRSNSVYFKVKLFPRNPAKSVYQEETEYPIYMNGAIGWSRYMKWYDFINGYGKYEAFFEITIIVRPSKALWGWEWEQE